MEGMQWWEALRGCSDEKHEGDAVSKEGCSGEKHMFQSARLPLNAASPTYYTAVVLGEFITFFQPLCFSTELLYAILFIFYCIFFMPMIIFSQVCVAKNQYVFSSISNCLFI